MSLILIYGLDFKQEITAILRKLNMKLTVSGNCMNDL